MTSAGARTGIAEGVYANFAAVLDWETTSVSELADTLRAVASKNSAFRSAGENTPALEDTVEKALSSLTDRQREILRRIGHGEDNLKIAISLEISESAVRAHVSRLYRVRGQETRIEVARLCWRHGI